MAKEFKNSSLLTQGNQRVALGIQESDESAFRFSLWNVKKHYNVKDYAANGDGVSFETASITAASQTLTITGASFTANDVGKTIQIYGAGAAGESLITTISAYTSATEVTVTDAAGTTVSDAIGTYGTDDTTAIQNTINACIDNGGGIVLLPVGVYLLNGPLLTNQDGINYNSQLYIKPPVNRRDLNRNSVTIEGETEPNYTQSGGVVGGGEGTNQPPNSGVILRSLIHGTGTDPSILCSRGKTTDPFEQNFNQPIVRNLSFQYTLNGSSQCTIGAINFSLTKASIIENVTGYPNQIALTDTAQPVAGIAGIITPDENTEQVNIVRNCLMGGYDSGYRLQGHWYAENIKSYVCRNAFQLYRCQMMGRGFRMHSLWCARDLVFNSGVTEANIFIDLSVEILATPAGEWYADTDTVVDTGNIGHGIVYYHMTDGAGSADNSNFSKTGGANLRCMPISFAAASSYTVAGSKGGNAALTDLLSKLETLGIIVDSTT